MTPVDTTFYELRSMQDWNVRYALESVEGVSEVATIGGHVKQYQVQLDPNKLLAHGVTTDDLMKAIQRSNQDVGGQVMEISGHEHVVRGVVTCARSPISNRFR